MTGEELKQYNREKARRFYYRHRERLLTERRQKYSEDPEPYRKACRKWFKKNPRDQSEYSKAWHAANKEEQSRRAKAYYQKHKERLKEKAKVYREQNLEKIKAYSRAWQKANRAHIRDYVRKKLTSDIQWKLRHHLRSKLHAALRYASITKSIRTFELLGCTVQQLMQRLEKSFEPGMSWENYGVFWHIDHIRPCSSFDLTQPNQQHLCFHWSNLRPLKIAENLAKGARWRNTD